MQEIDLTKLFEIMQIEKSGKLTKVYETKRRELNDWSYSKVVTGNDDRDYSRPFDFVDKSFPPTNEVLFDSKMP